MHPLTKQIGAISEFAQVTHMQKGWQVSSVGRNAYVYPYIFFF